MGYGVGDGGFVDGGEGEWVLVVEEGGEVIFDGGGGCDVGFVVEVDWF